MGTYKSLISSDASPDVRQVCVFAQTTSCQPYSMCPQPMASMGLLCGWWSVCTAREESGQHSIA